MPMASQREEAEKLLPLKERIKQLEAELKEAKKPKRAKKAEQPELKAVAG